MSMLEQNRCCYFAWLTGYRLAGPRRRINIAAFTDSIGGSTGAFQGGLDELIRLIIGLTCGFSGKCECDTQAVQRGWGNIGCDARKNRTLRKHLTNEETCLRGGERIVEAHKDL